jgi:enterochelin esterase family protein
VTSQLISKRTESKFLRDGSQKRHMILVLGLLATLTGCAQPPAPNSIHKTTQPGASGNDDDSNPAKIEPTHDDPIPEVDMEEIPVVKPDKGEVVVVDPPVVTPKPEDLVKDPGTDGDGDFTIGPNYSVSPDVSSKNGVPKGTLIEFTMSSKDSKIYQGKDAYLREKGDFTRKVWVYKPANYVEGTELPFMVIGDGGWDSHKNVTVKAIENLIAQKKIPQMAAILIDPGPLGGGDGEGSQRSFEYDNVTDKFVTWVESEVLPRAANEAKITLTKNPEGRATMGGSSSGAMAFTMAWFRPDLYRRVLTYSGTFVNRIQTNEHPQGAWEYHNKMLGSTEKKPLRVFIHASENDLNFGSDNNWLAANRAMAKVFKEKGYHYRFQYSLNASHIDSKVYKQTVPENLIWLWRGYPIK